MCVLTGTFSLSLAAYKLNEIEVTSYEIHAGCYTAGVDRLINWVISCKPPELETIKREKTRTRTIKGFFCVE